jgi:hypothetical protein
MNVTLAEMRTIVREMTARYTEVQMRTTQLDTFINRAYTLHFPEQFKNSKLTKPYVFFTVPNVDTYAFPYQSGISVDQGGNPAKGNITVNPPVFCQGYLLRYFQDKTTFYNRWPNLSVNQQIDTGDGTNGPYTGTIPSTPFYRAQKDIFGNVTDPAVVISAYDDTGFTFVLSDVPVNGSNTGNLAQLDGTVIGSVNYLTGQYTFTLPVGVIPTTATIYAAVVPYQASRPVDVLFYNQQIVFRPVPMQVFQVEFQVSQQPTDLIAAGDMPELAEWYLFICCIAAKLIYTNFPDPEGEATLKPIYDEQLLVAQRRTLRQLTTQRAATIFSQPGRPLAGNFLGNEYSGN